jgi:hypothetical protein
VANKHVDDLQADVSHGEGEGKGCVTKCVGSKWKKDHGSYRYQGYEAHNVPAKKLRYEPDLTRLAEVGNPTKERVLGGNKDDRRTPSNPQKKAGAWNFGFSNNFKNANRPYAHNYHHMVPWEAMSEGLNQLERKALQQAGYNLNAGINMIILPCFKRVGLILRMFTHPNDHPAYNVAVARAINQVKFEITGDERQHLKPEELPDLKDALESWEKAEWPEIMTAGEAANAVHLKNYSPSAMLLP